MRLMLYEDDLAKEHVDIQTSAVGFSHLNPLAQKAVMAVGKATFFRHEGTEQENYNVIYPPKK